MKNIVLFILRFAPVFIGSHSGGFLEYTSEVLRVLEAELIGYLTDGLRGEKQLFFGDADNFILYIFQGGSACFFFDKVAKIIG